MNGYAYKIYRAVVDLRPVSLASKGFEDWVVIDAKEDTVKKVAKWLHIRGSESDVIAEHSVWERSEQYEFHPNIHVIPLLNDFFQYFTKEWELPRIHLFEYNSHVFARVQGKTYHAKSMSFSRAFGSKEMAMSYEVILLRDYPNLGLFHLYRDIDNMLAETYNILLRLKNEEDRTALNNIE